MSVAYEIRVETLLGHEIQSGTISSVVVGSQERARDEALALAGRISRAIPDTRVVVWGKKILPSYTTTWRAWEGLNRDGIAVSMWLDGSDYMGSK